MNSEAQRKEEKEALGKIVSVFRGFMKGIAFAPVDQDQDPPDFLGKDQGGRNIGLELTCWLDGGQVGDSKRRDCVRNDLLGVLDWEAHSRPKNFSSIVITPRWDEAKNIKEGHRWLLREEFHRTVQDIDSTWESRKARHWKQVPEGSGFDYEAYANELKCYPTLSKYISSIWFLQPQAPSSSATDNSRLSVISDGPDLGLYDPDVAIQSLRQVIRSKVDDYSSKPKPKERLRAHNLHKLYLLVYADPELSYLNTPFQTCNQMRKSPEEGLIDAARVATKELSELPKVFDGISSITHCGIHNGYR